MPTHAILFDLDDTLVIEQPGAKGAFLATCERAQSRYGLDPQALYDATLAAARNLWYHGPHGEYARAIGLSSWEGLWATYEGDTPALAALRAWAPSYRHEAWLAGLAAFGINDAAFADELAAAYQTERRARHELFAEVPAVLESLHGRYRLAIVTNGVPDIQFDKLRATGIERHFERVVVSSEFGVGKPDPRMFVAAIERLDVAAAEAVMVGNSLRRDIGGAHAAGIRAIWVCRDDPARQRNEAPDIQPDTMIQDLTALSVLI